jgi:hypothetical protein
VLFVLLAFCGLVVYDGAPVILSFLDIVLRLRRQEAHRHDNAGHCCERELIEHIRV